MLMKDSFRVLQIATSLNKGTGVAGFMMNYFRAIDPDVVRFDFLIHLVKPDNYIDEVKARGSRVYVMPEVSGNKILSASKAISALASKAGGEYDAVHCHMPNIAFLHLPIWRERGIERRIIHSHTTESSPYRLRRVRNKLVESIGLRYATDFLASSNSAGLSTYGCRPFDVIPNAIDMTVFRQSDELRRRIRQALALNGKFVLGYVGRLAKGKNVDFLIEVLACLLKYKKNCVLLLVGAGEEEQALRRCAERKGLSEVVRFVGYRSDTEAFYNAMDVFLFPSEAEGLGLVAIEAQACGTPCILSTGVPIEADVSGTSRVLSVKDGADAWAQAALSVAELRTVVNRAVVESSIFNINRSAEYLVNYYLRGVR